MDKKQIYISFENDEYKINKSVLLANRADVIRLQKQIIMLKATRANKKRLIFELYRAISSLKFSIEKLSSKLPKSDLPKDIELKFKKKKIQKEKIPEFKSKERNSEDEELMSLDRELREINERIKKLIS